MGRELAIMLFQDSLKETGMLSLEKKRLESGQLFLSNGVVFAERDWLCSVLLQKEE